MKKFLDNNRIGVLMTIVVLASGSISVVGIGTTHVAMASQIGKLCVFFACGNANITGGTSSSSQPTPSTATLTVTKKVDCVLADCPGVIPSQFSITVTGDNPSPSSFVGSADGTKVTI